MPKIQPRHKKALQIRTPIQRWMPKTKGNWMTENIGTVLSGCMQVVHEMFYALDVSDYARLVSLFEPDGSLLRQGELLKGRQDITQAMNKRSATQRTRHVISNGFVESHASGLQHLVAYMTAYRFDDGALHEGSVAISRPLRISIVHASMVQTENSWRIARMTFTPEFEFVSDAG